MRQLTVQEADTLPEEAPRRPAAGGGDEARARGRGPGKEGVERIHIIDGREQEGLLGEVFSNEGIGTLIYANEYQAIRPAQKKDVRAVHNLIQQGVENDELVKRTRAELEKIIGDFFVFEVDRNPVACAALHVYPEQNKAELASVFVDARYENQGIGGKLIALRRERRPRAAGWRSCSASRRRRSTTSCRRAASSSARPTTCRRRAARSTSRTAAAPRC